MRRHYYRLTVVGCALCWFMVGLHFPILHQMTHHGRSVGWPILALVALIVLLAIAGLWALLRMPTSSGEPRGPGAAAA